MQRHPLPQCCEGAEGPWMAGAEADRASRAPPAPAASGHARPEGRRSGATGGGTDHVRSLALLTSEINYERFNSSNISIHSWSWNYRGAGTRLILQSILIARFA